MEKAGDGLVRAGDALAAMYNAGSQVLPVMVERADRALDLAERGVVALEVIAESSKTRR